MLEFEQVDAANERTHVLVLYLENAVIGDEPLFLDEVVLTLREYIDAITAGEAGRMAREALEGKRGTRLTAISAPWIGKRVPPRAQELRYPLGGGQPDQGE